MFRARVPAVVAALGLALSGLAVAAPAGAAPADHLIIDEAYLNGGSTGATFKTKFVQVSNPTAQPVNVSGWSVQYRARATETSFTGVIPLGDHRIPAGGTLLVANNSNGAAGAELPTPDVANAGFAFSGSDGGTLALSRSTTPLTGTRAAVLADTNVVDLLGYGTTNTFEGTAPAARSGYSVTSSLNRTGGTDTNDNAADFTGATPTPTACGTACDVTGGGTDPQPPTEPISIAAVQGTGATSPVANTTVTTTGVVTATYPTGGFDGAYIQTAGSGDVDLATHRASTGLFVSSLPFASAVKIGDHVRVTGRVTENFGMTQIAPAAGGWSVLTEPAAAVKPAEVAFPLSEAQRETLEGMLLAPQGPLTVTNNFTTNQFGEIGVAAGTKPLSQPTDVVRPRTPEYTALVAENLTRLVTLDDGAGISYLSAANKATPLPWLGRDNEVRTGAPVTITEPMVFDYRFNLWRLQPTERLVGAADTPATFGSTRTQAPRDVAGDVTLGSFNVLNYFTTTGEQYTASGQGTCTYFRDRDDNPITNDECTGNGPRGAADDVNLERQQVKIVKAINTLDADVVSLQELENSANLRKPRDAALDTLVAELNEAAGSDRWAAVPSPAVIPTVGTTDIIRNAFIYQKDAIELGSVAKLLDDQAFSNARAPLAQEFKVKGEANSDFVVIANHFKSKSASAGAGNADIGDGQSGSNASRVAQAGALVTFADDVAEEADTDLVFLAGDFNSYAKEDPMQVFADAGYVNVSDELSGEDTYQFQGRIGSLDHVLASAEAAERVRDADVWDINAPEAIAREYSRFNDNVTNLYDDSPFRSSDHDPTLVGFDPGPSAASVTVDAPRSLRLGGTLDVDVTVDATREGVVPTGAVSVLDGDDELATGTLDADGGATLSVDTDDLGVGTHLLTVRYAGDRLTASSSTTLRVTVLKAEVALAVSSDDSRFGTAGTVRVEADRPIGGLLYAAVGSRVVGVGSIADGVGSVTLGTTALEPGTHRITVYYAGDAGSEPVEASLDHTVLKAVSSIRATPPTGTVVVDRTPVTIRAQVSAPGFTPSGGTVEIRSGRTVVATGKVSSTGAVKIVTRPLISTGTKKLDVVFLGNARAGSSRTTVQVTVVRR